MEPPLAMKTPVPTVPPIATNCKCRDESLRCSSSLGGAACFSTSLAECETDLSDRWSILGVISSEADAMLVVVSAKNPKTGLELQKVHNNNEVVMVDVKGARARDKIDISIKHTVTGSGVIAQYSMSHHVSRRRTPRSGKPVDRPNFHRRSTWRATHSFRRARCRS
jgi:hypothetical protein